jgi:hypothetical protein
LAVESAYLDMRRFFLSILCLAVLGAACGSDRRTGIPTAPSLPSVPPPAPTPFTFAEQYTQIAVGEVVRRPVTSENPECIDEPGWKCQYFRLTAPSDGTLEIMMTVWLGTVTQGLDLNLNDSGDGEWWAPVKAPVKGGTTYQITVRYVSPGVEFELRTSLTH